MAIAGKNQATGSSNDLVSVTLEARFDVSIHGSTRPGEGAASVDFEHMVYPPPASNQYVGGNSPPGGHEGQTICSAATSTSSRTARHVTRQRTKAALEMSGGCRRAGSFRNFRAYSSQTPFWSRLSAVTAR